MRRRLYQLRDVVSDCLVGAILLERCDAPAVRSFYAGLSDAASDLSKFPKDYELICLGEYDDVSGIGEQMFLTVASGLDFVNSRESGDGS